MLINIRADAIDIDGYVNAVERNSKPLWSRIGQFIERICKGAFSKALQRNDDVHILLNHDWDRDLGSTKAGNLQLAEDSIGLRARATITDAEVVRKARDGELVGWSFGFMDTPDGVESGIDSDTGLPLRKVHDLNLFEVSVLDRSKTPAYDGTLVMARADDVINYTGEAFMDEVMTIEERTEEPKEEPKDIDYTAYETMISQMKGENNEGTD